MRKVLTSFVVFLASPWTHIVVGWFAIVFAWCMSYEIDYALEVVSFIIGVVVSAGVSCVDLGIQKLLIARTKRHHNERHDVENK